MHLFPSPLEGIVVDALLLLSNSKPRSPSPLSHSLEENIASEENSSLFSISSKSKSSSVVRKRRSKVCYRSEHREEVKRSKTDTGCSSLSAHLKNQEEAILKLLSHGSSSEVRIRQQLGDSPDTSKALRMLLKKDEIKRSGMGGRFDPYIYKIA